MVAKCCDLVLNAFICTFTKYFIEIVSIPNSNPKKLMPENNLKRTSSGDHRTKRRKEEKT
jgi:hypothetical protein